MDKLFKPNLEESQIYGNQISDLYYLLSLDSTQKIEGMTKTISIGKIPCVFRFLGIPSGTVELIPRNIPHMIGFGQEKTTASYRNMPMKVDIKSVLDGDVIVVSGYEKDNSPKEFFTRLYDNGFCIYDGENKGYFEDIKVGTGARDGRIGPLPIGPVTCTVPVDKSLSPEGISPSDNQSISTKSAIVNSYKSNTSKLIAIFQEMEELA